MGNLLSRLFGNIPTDPSIGSLGPTDSGSRDGSTTPHNTPASSTSSVTQGMILHFGIPVLCMVALAIHEAQRRQEREKLLQQLSHTESEAANKLHEAARKLHEERQNLIQQLRDIEKKASIKHKGQMRRLEYYEEGLKDYLDIKCSPFKDRTERFDVDRTLKETLSRSSLRETVKYDDLKEVFNHDNRFCGGGREKNGRLRPLMVRNWKIQLERNKYREIVDGIKSMFE